MHFPCENRWRIKDESTDRLFSSTYRKRLSGRNGRKRTFCMSKSKISLPIRTVWSESSLSPRNSASLALRIYTVKIAQTDLSLGWAHISEFAFTNVAVHMYPSLCGDFNKMELSRFSCNTDCHYVELSVRFSNTSPHTYTHRYIHEQTHTHIFRTSSFLAGLLYWPLSRKKKNKRL